jgi:hypothetical protein
MGKTDPTDSESIRDELEFTYHLPWLNVKLNQRSLTKYTDKTAKIWLQVFG